MITAFIMFTIEPGLVTALAQRLLDVPGIAEAYSVAGPFDLVAVARVKTQEALAELVTDRVATLEGVIRTETLIAFRAFSRKDLGLLWDVGE
jgi:DNA-binding Lrp family transcriptional regulator